MEFTKRKECELLHTYRLCPTVIHVKIGINQLLSRRYWFSLLRNETVAD